MNVNVHHNNVSANLSTGDELFSVTPAGSGGVTICTGSDYYKFNYNWICGNLSTGDGGGFGHIGYSWNGDIEHNTIIFNQSTKPDNRNQRRRCPHHGCPRYRSYMRASRPTRICLPSIPNAPERRRWSGPGDQCEPDHGNAAESGSGGGVRFQGVNGRMWSPSPRGRTDGIPSKSPTTSSPTTLPAGTALEFRLWMRWR